MKEIHLSTPLSRRDVEGLSIGDVIYLSGDLYTCRALFHRRVIDEGVSPPFDTREMNVMMHTGPLVVREDYGWRVVSLVPTTSNRFNKWGARIIGRLGLRAIIGKGSMNRGVAEACKRYGCIHLTSIGVMGALLPSKVEVKTLYWHDLGPIEATWILKAEGLGPFLVDIDTKGKRYFEGIEKEIEEGRERAYKRLGIPPDFEYTRLSSTL